MFRALWAGEKSCDAVFTCLHSLFVVAFQGDRGETGSPGPAGFAGPPVSNMNGTEQILAVSGLQV